MEGPGRATAGVNRGAALNQPAADAAAPRCTSVRKALRFYTGRLRHWQRLRGAAERPLARGVGCPRFLVKVRQQQAAIARKTYYLWLDTHRLRDFVVRDGNHAWHKAVREVQKVYPGTESWLLSCSAAEGGHGRWVTYGGGSDWVWAMRHYVVGGWLQFKYPTFSGMYHHAIKDVRSKGYLTPPADLPEAWLSPLAQALAGGWARYTGNDRYHWSASFSNGC